MPTETHANGVRTWRVTTVATNGRGPRVVISLTLVLRACRLLLRPGIVCRVGIPRRATAIDGFWAQFVVPGFVAVIRHSPYSAP